MILSQDHPVKKPEMTSRKERPQFYTMSQTKHKKIESERLKNVAYHQESLLETKHRGFLTL